VLVEIRERIRAAAPARGIDPEEERHDEDDQSEPAAAHGEAASSAAATAEVRDLGRIELGASTESHRTGSASKMRLTKPRNRRAT
jgi:hypothetical protein